MKSLYLPEWDATIRYFDIAGENEPIIYLAGLSTPSLPCLLALATHPKIRGQRSILIDYLGTGFSDKPHDFDHHMQNHAKTIAAVLKHEGITSCTVIGHSMGGTVGLYLALDNPNLVTRLIMAESNIEAGGGTGTRYIASFSEAEFVHEIYPKMMQSAKEKAAEGDAIATFQYGTWAGADPIGIHRSSVSLVNLDSSLKDKWLTLAIPKAFIIGEETHPAKTGERLPDTPFPEELAPYGIPVPIVPKSGHMMMVDNPEGFAQAVAEALA